VPVSEATSSTGEPYIRHISCPACQGSGTQAKRVPLSEFADLLYADPMEPDYQRLAHMEPLSQFQDSREAAGI
jgi:hypothetical protein